MQVSGIVRGLEADYKDNVLTIGAGLALFNGARVAGNIGFTVARDVFVLIGEHGLYTSPEPYQGELLLYRVVTVGGRISHVEDLREYIIGAVWCDGKSSFARIWTDANIAQVTAHNMTSDGQWNIISVENEVSGNGCLEVSLQLPQRRTSAVFINLSKRL